MPVWRSDSNLGEVVLFFHHVDSEDWTQVAKLSGKCFYLLSPFGIFLEIESDSTAQASPEVTM